MDFLVCVRFYRSFEEGQELCAVTGRVAFAVDFTGADLQCGEQVGGAVPDVVVGAFLGGAEVDRQQRLGPV